MDFHVIHQEPNPELKANPISRLFLLWVLPFFRKGAKKDLELSDVYQNLSENSSSGLGTLVEGEWNKEIKRAVLHDRPAKLWRVVRSIIWGKYLLVGIAYSFDELVLRTIQPIVLRNFIATFREETKSDDVRRSQFLYAGVLVLVTFSHALLFQKLVGVVIHMGMKLRLGISSLIYRKILKLRKSDSEQANVGKLVNLLSSDVSRLDQSFHMLHFFYIAPIQLGLYSYLLWNELGAASFGGIGCILVILPTQILVGRFSMYFRTRIAKRTDERGRFLNEIIAGIRLIKMYAWEKPFCTVVSQLRRSEIKFIRRHLYLRGMYVSVQSIATKLIPFCALIIYVAMGNTLTAEKVFFSISVFNTIMQAIMNRIPNAASQLGELVASLNRIEHFMLSKDNSDSKRDRFEDNIVQCSEFESIKQNTNGKESTTLTISPSIIMENYSASWTEARPTLKELNVKLKGSELVMVVGHVGSGKSSFLNAILSELPITTGKCCIQGRLSYASQEAWIFPASVRQNILFGLEMDKERYWNTIKLCCLSDDLNQFPDADFSLVGERGVALSGGQKARVNLARAIYQDAEIYLLDDPLSAVDTKVSKLLFNDCIKEHLNGKLRILVTHQLQYLPLADHIIVLNRDGEIWCQGTYEELKRSEVDFTSLISDEYFNDKSDDAENGFADETLKGNANRRQSKIDEEKKDSPKGENNGLLSGSPVQRRKDEQKNVGSIDLGTYFRYFKSGGSYVTMLFLVAGFLLTQSLYNFVDYWLSLWTNAVAEEDIEFDLNVTRSTNFTRDVGRNSSVIARDPEDFDSDQNMYVYVYCGLLGAFICVAVFRSILFFKYCMRISINLHDLMFGSIVRAPVKFFDDNPSGRIMNRFTKDLNHTDEHLPVCFFDFINILLALFGMLVLNITANYYTAVPSVILLLILWRMRKFYLASARDLKRIESVGTGKVVLSRKDMPNALHINAKV